MPPSIFDFVKTEQNNFETQDIKIADNWDWNFRKHTQLIFHLKNGMFFTGDNDYLRTFKAVMEPILELSYWTEDIEVKDVVFAVEGSEKDKALSFILKKYHDDVYAKEHNLDELFDEITESDIDYGGVVVQKGVERPEVIDLNKIAFCDQTDFTGGAFGVKMSFTPSKLRQMTKYGWGLESNGATISINDLCILADSEKESNTQTQDKNHTTSKNIDVVIVRGDLPASYLEDNDDMENYYGQLHVVAFYTDTKGHKQGVTLYRKKDNGKNVKFFTSKKVTNRALGRGMGERLIQPQIWTNWLSIHKHNMIEAGSKIALYTDDPTYTDKNKIQDMDNLEITTIEEGKRINQVPTLGANNIQLFSNEINAWFEQAQLDGSAQDPIIGKEAVSGTTFRGQERSVAQAKGGHDRRRGKRAKFIEEIYRDFILDDIINNIVDEEFYATLSDEEMEWVFDTLAEKEADNRIKKASLEGKIKSEEDRKLIKEEFKKNLFKTGNRHKLKVLREELENVRLKITINVSNKQKNLADLSDKLLSIFQFVFANPQAFQQAMQNPALAKAFSNILEFSGLSVGEFQSLVKPIEQTQITTPTQSPQQITTPELNLAQPAQTNG